MRFQLEFLSDEKKKSLDFVLFIILWRQGSVLLNLKFIFNDIIPVIHSGMQEQLIYFICLLW